MISHTEISMGGDITHKEKDPCFGDDVTQKELYSYLLKISLQMTS